MILTSFIETASDHNSQQDFFGFPENHCNDKVTIGPNKKLHSLQRCSSNRSKVFNPLKTISSILLLSSLLLVNPANAACDENHCCYNSDCGDNFCAGGGGLNCKCKDEWFASKYNTGQCQALLPDGYPAYNNDYNSCSHKNGICGICGPKVPDGRRCSANSDCSSGWCDGEFTLGCNGYCKNKAADGQPAFPNDSGGWDYNSCQSGEGQCGYCGPSNRDGLPCSENSDCDSGWCQGEVYAFTTLGCSGYCASDLQNIALNKPTSQSSTRAAGGSSSRAVDGNTSGIWSNNSVTHTNSQTDPWWNVDLQSPYDINKIKIYNRADCCTSRLGGFKVTVYNGAREEAAWTWTHGGGTPGAVTTLTLPPSTIGDNVEVRIPGSNKILSLAEVEVFGRPVENPLVNVALNKPTYQSSTYPDGSASRAVDGNTSGLWSTGSVTHTNTQTNPWWTVDLQSLYSISTINIHNRIDCCSERLSGFKVIVYNGETVIWTWTHSGGSPDEVTTLTLPPSINGDKVEVIILGRDRILSLAEVEVFGRLV